MSRYGFWPVLGFVLVAVVAFYFLWNALPPANVTESASVIATYFAAIGAIGTLMTVLIMAAERLDRNQASMLADMELTNSQAIYFTLKNTGTGTAASVTVKFAPDPIDYFGKKLSSLPLLQAPIPVIQPGGSFRQFFHTAPSLLNQDVPKAFKITVQYKDEAGRQHSRVVDVDLAQYKGTTLPPKTVDEQIGEVAKQLEDIKKDLRSVIKMGSLVVESPEQQRVRMQEIVEEMESRSKANGEPQEK
ncbi:MAG: hypothetical protein ACYC3S_11180 [Chloroflexota bacterium]